MSTYDLDSISLGDEVLLVKLADRLHNMRTVEFMAEKRRRIKAKETLIQIIPIAKKIGQPKLVNELYDLSLKYLHERIQTVIHREEYINLPLRFQKKLEHDLQYVTNARIPGLKKIYLFGSCARGEVRSASDIDLMILTENRITDRTLTADIRWTLDDPIDGVRTDVAFISEGMEGSSRIFKREIDRDKKLILEITE